MLSDVNIFVGNLEGVDDMALKHLRPLALDSARVHDRETGRSRGRLCKMPNQISVLHGRKDLRSAHSLQRERR